MLRKTIAVLSAAALTAIFMTSCAKTNTTETTETTTDPAAVTTEAAATTATGETTTATGDINAATTAAATGNSTNAATTSAATENKTTSAANSASSDYVKFPAGDWENSDVRFEFNSDGSGIMMTKDSGTGSPLSYETVSGKNSLTIHFGSADNSETVTYQMPDDYTLVLNFASGRSYTLSHAGEFEFPTGTFENDSVSYTFNADGSGEFTSKDSGSGVGLTYDVQSTDTVVFHMGSADASELVRYERLDANAILLSFEDGSELILQRAY